MEVYPQNVGVMVTYELSRRYGTGRGSTRVYPGVPIPRVGETWTITDVHTANGKFVHHLEQHNVEVTTGAR